MDRGIVRSAAGMASVGAVLAWLAGPGVSAGELYLGPSAYYATPDSGLHAKSDLGAQLTMGYRFTPHLGLELLSENSQFELNDGTGTVRERGASAQGIYRFLIPDQPLWPFVTLGGGWMHTSFRHKPDDVPLIRGGVGLSWDLPNLPLSVRADASFRHLFGNRAIPFYASQDQTDRVYTFGLQYSFGHDAQRNPEHRESVPAGSAKPNPAAGDAAVLPGAATRTNNCTVDAKTNTCSGLPDQDGDGVPDAIDKCPDTPPNAVVDADGCLLYLRKDAPH